MLDSIDVTCDRVGGSRILTNSEFDDWNQVFVESLTSIHPQHNVDLSLLL